jgi:hypothetical protein
MEKVMKYLCISYFSPGLYASHSDAEIEEAISKSKAQQKKLHETGKMVLDVGVERDSYKICREAGELQTREIFITADKMIGGVTIIEAETIEDAIEVAQLHPAAQVDEGEYLGWELEVRPINYFEMKLLDH